MLLACVTSALLAACGTVPAPLDGIVTGSAGARPVSHRGEPVPKGVASEDWAVARLALGEALGAKASAPSVPWENVASATRGTVTPIGDATSRDGAKCRAFLMSFVRSGGEDWLQGEACRGAGGGWTVDEARLLEKT